MLISPTITTMNRFTDNFVADHVKKDQEEVPGMDDTFTWMVKEASNWVETMFVEEDSRPYDENKLGGGMMTSTTTNKIDEDTTGTGTGTSLVPAKKTRYDGLQMAAVLQETRIFHDDIAVKHDPAACLEVLAKLLRLKDDDKTIQFTRTQATDVFFATTKLFVCDDEYLRRFVYLFLKEIYTLCDPNDVIIVTSSLTKDMTCNINIYRANAMRVLARIIDSNLLGAIERYVKQAIIDDYAPLASAGLLAGLQWSQGSSENSAIVRRWITETHQAIQKHRGIVQYHALLLLYQMKSSDRLAVSKIVSKYSKKGALTSPLAIIMIIRYTTKLVLDESQAFPGLTFRDGSTVCREGYEFLTSCLKHSSELVVHEAARAFVILPTAIEDLHSVVGILESLMLSPKPCVRLGALKTIAEISIMYPRIIVKCNDELSNLLQDQNPLIATLALTTLLKTATEGLIVDLLEKVAALLGTMENEFRVSIVKSILQLSVSYPSKRQLLMNFLGTFLKHPAAYEFKHAIVSGIVESLQTYPETMDDSLFILAVSLDTCEHVNLSTEILHIVAEMGPLVKNASKHIPYLYNRFLLGSPPLRAAAVSSLSKFASHHVPLRPSILLLLRKCLRDDNEETRERAAAAISVLSASLVEADATDDKVADAQPLENDLAAHIFSPMSMSFAQLSKSLEAYQATSGEMENDAPVSFESLPIVKEDPKEQTIEALHCSYLSSPTIRRKVANPTDEVYAIPELATLGKVAVSSSPIALTERETEYVVHCTKHVYVDHIVLQFKVENTVENQRLDTVSVAVMAYDNDEDLYEVIGEMSAPSISYGDIESCFVVLKRKGGKVSPLTLACGLEFTVWAVDEESGEDIGEPYEEEYTLEDIVVEPADFMEKNPVKDFRKAWDCIGRDHEVAKKVGLQFGSLQEAVDNVVKFLGMEACDNTLVLKRNGQAHMLHLSGTFLGHERVLARAQISPFEEICALKIAVRCQDTEIGRTVAGWIQ
jgi:coatomer protein complex subunit gamma